VKTYHSPEVEARGADRIRSLVEVRLKDGRVLSAEAEISRGTPDRPMGRDGMAVKFNDCASGSLSDERIRTALDTIYRVEELGSVSELVEAMVG
jgi:2-methylcitrate dehydratase PrpD